MTRTAALAIAALAAAACGSTPPPTRPPGGGSAPAPRPSPGAEELPPRVAQWTKQLRDPRSVEQAITELETLGDPRAIPALVEAWHALGRPVRPLYVIIALARPLTPSQAKAALLVDYESTGRPASWDAAMPALTTALLQVDTGDPRSMDGATLAADALGEAQSDSALELLVEAAARTYPSQALRVHIGVIINLAKYRDRRARLGLVAVLGRAMDAYERAQGDEARYPAILAGATVNALGELADPDAVDSLLQALYRVPALAMQTRRALAASGPGVAVRLRSILRGEDAMVNEVLASRGLDESCPADGSPCKSASRRDFWASILLGDVAAPGDRDAMADLLAVLRRPDRPLSDLDGAPPITSANAVFDALRAVGDASIEVELRAMWADPGAPVGRRTLAANAYGWIGGDSASAELRKLLGAKKVDESLRRELATTLSRVGTTDRDLEAIKTLADRHRRAAAKTKDAHTTDVEIELAHQLDLGVARLEVAVRCKRNTTCYAETLTATPQDVIARLAPEISDLDRWSKVGILDLRAAQIDRAMAELGKQGTAASQHVTALLDALDEKDRVIRSSVLLALRRIAPVPCGDCEARLSATVDAEEGLTAMADLRLETSIVRNYFRWAGR